MPLATRWLYRHLGRAYFPVYLLFEVGSALIVALATIGVLSLYEDMSTRTFLELLAFTEAGVLIASVWTIISLKELTRPLRDWIREGRPRETALDAWRLAVSLPRDSVIRNGWVPFVIVALPCTAFVTLHLDLPFYSALIILAGSLVAIAYTGVLHFFGSELWLRPVVEDVATRIDPSEVPPHRLGVPLRWKLLGALPLINVITGVAVSGLSADTGETLNDLGVDVIIAVVVAATISLELTVLLTRSVLNPVDDLLETTERVREGDLEARVPLTSGDELGRLAASMNQMLDGLAEREALRDAFGSYVDPEVADRVIEEGELLDGEEREATLLFADVRDFTPFSERSSASETVAFLNELFELIVPILLDHGGHANKFVGDGVLGVFGAPERLTDHADRAVAAGRDMVAAVADRFGGEMQIGVGINSGPVIVGSVGGGGRLEFAVIGDAVNVASRVEGCTRETGDALLLTEATRCLLVRPGEVGELAERGELELKGKAAPVRLWTPGGVSVPLDIRSDAASETLKTQA